MMRRLFWLGLGVAAGALAVRKLTRAAQSYSPRGLADSARGSVTGLVDSVRDFVDEARRASAERERELLTGLTTAEDGAAYEGEHRSRH
ncbi:MAG TPA: hypothetical protein VGR21_06140 [Cryptosporangiaceae bacterium]|nr:hypothetical protein [Cryptosporangiaceae bacterium]